MHWLKKILPSRRISLHHCLQQCPRKEWECCSYPLSGCLFNHTEPSVSQNPSPLPRPTGHRELPWGHRYRLENSVAGMGTKGLWATSPWNFPVPSRPAQSQSYLYHCHVMIGCCLFGLEGWIAPSSWYGQLRQHGKLVAHGEVLVCRAQ
jgi:hypothetical protein